LSLYGKDRGGMRQVFFNTWQKYKQSLALQGVESMMIDVILLHPEYHSILENQDKYLDFDFPPEQGKGNPFLHMSLHVTIEEQLSIDNPTGIRQNFQTLMQNRDKHDALHVLLECLAEAIWKAQRNESADLEKDYVACIAEQVKK